ncbi:uncharacterized protein LOC135716096 [Ochlerotatus camptorhynchus]|uniref:uncharacterized protein LOC135716096 n=1 Tax=Ochlerotatus camptorhynchus TaxID=644619 RepID=UPI0031D04585
METYRYPCCDCDEDYDASVQCEKCQEWYHFECVGVDESVAEVVWFCSTCVGEDRSIRQSLGVPGQTRIHPMVINHPGSQTESSGKKVDKVASKNISLTKGRISRAVAQDEDDGNTNKTSEQEQESSDDEELDVQTEKSENHTRFLNDLLKSLNRHSSLPARVNPTDSVPKSSRIGKSVLRKSASVPSAESTRVRALRELRDLEERNRLDELEEENQQKILELQRKRIARRKKALERRMELTQIINGSDGESDSGAEVESMDKSGKPQPEKQLPKSLGAVRKDPKKRSAENDIQDLFDRFKELLEDRNGSKPQKPVPGKSTRTRSLLSANPRLPRPSFKKDDEALESILDGGDYKGDKVVADGPTRLQIASRQVFPRSLPKFYGAAEEWPIFISAYEQANQSCGFTNAENLVRLQDALKGKALDTVRNRLLLPENVPLIIEKLRKRFGNPEILSTRLATKIQQLEGPSSESLESVIEFGSAVEEFTQHLKAAGLMDHWKNPILMQSLVQKLPSYYAMEWVDYKRRAQSVDLETFGAFMEGLVEKALEATFEKADAKEKGKMRNRPQTKAFVHVTDGDSGRSGSVMSAGKNSSPQPQRRELKCSVCQKSGHYGRNCQELLKQSVAERWKTVTRLNLCPLWLYDHGQRSCRIRVRCKVDGCPENHNALLHGGPAGYSRTQVQCNSHRQSKCAVLFRMVPVTLYNGKKRVDTLALIDEGSSVTMVDSELVRTLGADGPVEPLQMTWTNGVQRTEYQSKKVVLEISARDSSSRYDLLEAHTVHRLNLPAQKLDSAKLVKEFKHLEDIDIPSYERTTPKVLLGIDNLHLIAPLDSRIGESDKPVAILCKLGWTAYGPQPNVVGKVHFLGHHRCSCEECSKADKDLDEAMKKHYQLEDVGVSPIRLESKEDRRAREILEKTTRRVGSRFETGLLWKEDDVRFPESLDMAMKRLRCLEARMNRNPGVQECLQKQLEEYLAKGYAHRITEQELKETPKSKVWYLPLNYVVHPKKPGKVWLVWDAAARAHGVSLNDKLLKGPDMITLLPAVISGFRERNVAFGGDIREMFHQAWVRAEDRQAQRFLFVGPVETYVMDVVIFGSTCSPCSAQYVKNLNAREHAEQYPEAADAIVRKHYVDDYFDSADTVEEAVRLAMDVRRVHANGGFEIRNWVSNSQEVLRQLGEEKSVVKPLEVDKHCTTERVLGVLWDPEGDHFVFSTEIRQDLQPYIREGAWPTKRIVLRCIASMFDPKQFLAPLLIHGRIILQDLWRSGIGWHEKLTEAHYKRWVQWTQLFHLIDEIRVPRCYLGGLDSKVYETVQLHVFTDAGDAAYGCVAYFRFEDGEVVHCTFIEAKAKVAPLQYLSTPRLELEAAVLGARLTKSICDANSVPVAKHFLWCDSDTVVSWVKSDQRRYKPFVAYRIGEILSITNPEDWRWVGTKDNPADDLTKWGKGTEIKSGSRWFHGPDFLYHGVEEWPKQKRPKVPKSSGRECCCITSCYPRGLRRGCSIFRVGQ